MVGWTTGQPVMFEETNMSENWMAGAKPTKHTGIWKTSKGYRVRARAVDPRTGAQREANRHYEAITLDQAVARQLELRQELRAGGREEQQERPKYAGFAESLTRRKIANGDLASAATQTQWAHVQDAILLPYFGEWFVDAIRRRDVLEWLTTQGQLVRKGKLSPNTVNSRLRVLLTTLREAVVDLDLEHDPTLKVEPVDTSTHETYTEEEPNSLTVDELKAFLVAAQRLYPQHYAMLLLGFATGRRPSELRPLRRQGKESDVLWDEGVLLVRRSETRGQAMNKTKTGVRLRVALPPELVDTLRWHVRHLPDGPEKESDLLFPSEVGGYRSSTGLAKAIPAIAEVAGIRKHLTPRCMRRTYQDLMRAAGVNDLVVRAISGHATAEMQAHYSTVGSDEVKAGLAKVVELLRTESGYPSGYPTVSTQRAAA